MGEEALLHVQLMVEKLLAFIAQKLVLETGKTKQIVEYTRKPPANCAHPVAPKFSRWI